MLSTYIWTESNLCYFINSILKRCGCLCIYVLGQFPGQCTMDLERARLGAYACCNLPLRWRMRAEASSGHA